MKSDDVESKVIEITACEDCISGLGILSDGELTRSLCGRKGKIIEVSAAISLIDMDDYSAAQGPLVGEGIALNLLVEWVEPHFGENFGDAKQGRKIAYFITKKVGYRRTDGPMDRQMDIASFAAKEKE